MTDAALSVAELTAMIRGELENTFPAVWVEGEVSQAKQSANGHVYFTLKDADASLSCVMWRSTVARCKGFPDHGDKVELKGGIKVYPPRGSYQLDVRSWRVAGKGELDRKFRETRERLAAEGLFDPELKQELPYLPQRIALITSATGAARHDMIRSIRDRFPPADIVFIGASVQGDRAVPEIVRALARADRVAGVDVIVVGRGGGSLEDLWAFNEEAVVRAIANCRRPVVSAVGHEVDVTLSDFVADARALTPTAVGPMIVPEWDALWDRLDDEGERLGRALRAPLESASWRIRSVIESRAWERPADLVHEAGQRCDEAMSSMTSTLRGALGEADARIRISAGELEALSPLKVLSRGYGVALDDSGRLLRARRASVGDSLQVRLSDGNVSATVTGVDHD